MKKPVFGLFVLLMLCVPLAFAGLSDKEKADGVAKTSGNDLYRPFLINNVFNYYSNNGDGSFNKYSTNNEGFEFYKGSGKTCIYEDGIVWGGYHKGYTIKDSKGNNVPQAKVGGSVYRHGVSAGPIVQYGTATTDPVGDDPTNPANRVYRVRPDINPKTAFADVQAKIQSEELTYINRYESYSAQDIYTQYINDWNQWPASLGAPFAYGPDPVTGKPRQAPAPYDPTLDIPGQPGSDQTLWYVGNDCNESRTAYVAGSPVIGLEMRRTVWGYKRKGALGQTIFTSSVFVNKSGAEIDTMYLVQWSDPDLGDGGDDYVGCDTTRSLGFVYNGRSSDAMYGTAIPSAGFDFFQGPIVKGAPSDTAVFQLQKRAGFKNLPMSTFDFFISTIAQFTDPLQGPGGDTQWYRLMKGTIAASGSPFIDPTTNLPTKFCLYGDPTKSQTGSAGWVDGMAGLTPADRRLCLVTGPFTMAPGDTQELVVGLLGGLGADYLSSINVLKSIDDKAQSAYNSLFALPAPPASPVVSVAALDGEIILSWGDGVTLSKTEGGVSQGFAFEGYNVYEFPGPSNSGGILLGTFDLVDGITTISDTAFDPTSGLNLIQIIQQGSDNDIIHAIDLTSSKVTGARLVDGNPYYFGVTAFSYNANPPAAAGTHSLESSPSIQAVVPHTPNPGTRYTSKPGDAFPVTLATAPGAIPSDGSVTATVVDQTKLTGDSYSVSFSNDAVLGTVWSMKDVTKNTVLISGQTNQSGDNHYPILDGMNVKVSGPPPGMKTWSIPNGARRFSPVGGALFGLEGFSNAGDPTAPQDRSAGTIGMASNLSFGSIGTTLSKPTDFHDVLLKWAKVDSLSKLWDPRVVQTDTNYSYAYRYLRAATADPTTFVPPRPEFLPFIITKASGYPYQDYLPAGVPFSAWDMSYTPPRRLAVGHFENNQANGLVDGRYWPALTTVDNSAADGPREMCFIFSSPYTTTPFAPMNTNMSGNATTPMMWVLTCARRNDPPYPGNDQFLITANKVNTSDHTFSWASVKQVIGDAAAAKLDVTKANVFPNPYLGFNSLETNKYARFVTFTHLPASATIRIFNLSGTLVRTIIKNDPSQFIQWDLNNEKGFPVAAGMYIAYIDMHDLGTKTLKLGVIPEQQYLDRW
jgi:hypothetical protein